MNTRQGWSGQQLHKAETCRQNDKDEAQFGESNAVLLGRRVFGDVNSRNALNEIHVQTSMSTLSFPRQLHLVSTQDKPYGFREDALSTPQASRTPTSPKTPSNCLQAFTTKTFLQSFETDGALKDLDDEPMYGSPGSRLSTPSIGTPTTDEQCSPAPYSYSKFMIDDDILLKPCMPDNKPAGPTRDMSWYQESFRDSQCVTLAPQPLSKCANQPRTHFNSGGHDKDFLGFDLPVLDPMKDAIFEGEQQNVDLVARPRNFAVFAPTPISNVLESWVRHVREGHCEAGDSDMVVASTCLPDSRRRTRGSLS